MPPYGSTYGPEVVDFMEQIGRPLDPWQAAIVVDAFGLGEDGLWASFEVVVLLARQNGKGGVTEAIELGGLFLFREPLMLHSAHQFKTSTSAFRRLQDIIDGSDWLTKRVKMISRSKGDESIELTRAAGGGRLQFVARTLGSGRGLTGSKNIFDEAYALTIGQYAAQTPTLATLPNPQIIYTSTPPDDDTGPMPEDAMLPSVRKRAMKGGGRTSMYEWSPAKGNFDRTDPEVWYECNPALGIRIKPWFLKQQLDAFTEAGRPAKFDTEHLGLWHDRDDIGWIAFREEDWKAAQDPNSGLVGQPVYCIESNRDMTMISIVAAGEREDKMRHVELVDRFPTDVGKLIGGMKKRIEKFDPLGVVIDPAGPAGYLINDIQKHCDIDVIKPSSRAVAAACGSLYVGISSSDPAARDLRVRPHPALDAAARVAEWRDRGDAKIFDRRNEDLPDVGPIMGAALADWGYQQEAASAWAFFE